MIASIIGSGINGNAPASRVGIPEFSASIASIIGSGINGNTLADAIAIARHRYRFYYWKWN